MRGLVPSGSSLGRMQATRSRPELDGGTLNQWHLGQVHVEDYLPYAGHPSQQTSDWAGLTTSRTPAQRFRDYPTFKPAIVRRPAGR